MEPIEKEVILLYDRFWAEIDDIRSSKIISQFLYNIAFPKDWFINKTCLDVGSGSRFAVWALQQLGATCHTCDLGFSGIQHFRERIGGSRNLPLVNASALALPFSCEVFDFVYCNGVLHHTTNPRQSFSELSRVTHRGGILFVGLYGTGGIYNAVLQIARVIARFFPYDWTNAIITPILRGRRVPNSFMPAKISILDNLYIPIRESFREKEIRKWFIEDGFQENKVIRTKTTIYDHNKRVNRLIYGEGYIQLRGHKPRQV